MTVQRHSLKSIFEQAVETLWAHPLRSFLTVLGVMIGTAAVIAVGALVSGLQRDVTEQVEQFGTNSAIISKLSLGADRNRKLSEEERKRKPLAIEDAAAISQLPSVMAASPILRPTGVPPVIRFHRNEVRTPLLRGVWADYARTRDVILAEGRFFNEAEDRQGVAVCVVGYNIAEKLFAGYEPLGKEITIGNKLFTVVGRLEKAKTSLLSGGGMNPDNLVFIPYGLMHTMNPAELDLFITAQAASGNLDRMIDDITALLRRRRNVSFNQPDNFTVSTPSGIIASFSQILTVIGMIVIPITSIALLVGGIGVMNIMLVSVKERTKEIGIRRAVGARQFDITLQFLLEAVMLTGLGGLIGIGFGMLASFAASYVFPTNVPLAFIAIGFGVSVAVGLIFGIYPATKAARLDPIEALRYE
jgi:putative ABC transport system permease protein